MNVPVSRLFFILIISVCCPSLFVGTMLGIKLIYIWGSLNSINSSVQIHNGNEKAQLEEKEYARVDA